MISFHRNILYCTAAHTLNGTAQTLPGGYYDTLEKLETVEALATNEDYRRRECRAVVWDYSGTVFHMSLSSLVCFLIHLWYNSIAVIMSHEATANLAVYRSKIGE